MAAAPPPLLFDLFAAWLRRSSNKQTGEVTPLSERTDAQGESWWLEDMLPRPQVSRSQLLPDVTAGTCAAVGCARESDTRHCEAPEHVTPAQGRRITDRCI